MKSRTTKKTTGYDVKESKPHNKLQSEFATEQKQEILKDLQVCKLGLVDVTSERHIAEANLKPQTKDGLLSFLLAFIRIPVTHN